MSWVQNNLLTNLLTYIKKKCIKEILQIPVVIIID